MAAATGHRNRSLNRKSRAPLNGHTSSPFKAPTNRIRHISLIAATEGSAYSRICPGTVLSVTELIEEDDG